MKRNLRLTALASAILLGLVGCSGSGNSNVLNNHNKDDVTEVASQDINIAAYSIGVDESVELIKQDGTVMAITTPTEEGKLTFANIPSLPANTPLIANIKDAEGNISLQALYSAGEVQDGISITPATTLITQMLDNSNTDVLIKRDELIAQMTELDMITAEDWNALQSEAFDNDSLYGYISQVSAEDLDNFVTGIKQEIADKDISKSTMQAGFHSAHGGIAEIRVIDNGVLSFMGGEAGSIPAAAFTLGDIPLDTDKYTVSLKDEPSWLQIADNGAISYQAPEVTERSIRENFTIIVTPTSGATPKEVVASFAIDPAKVLLEGFIGPAGGKIENDWKDIYLTAEAGALSQEYQVKFVASADEYGALSFKTVTIPEITESDAELIEFNMPSQDVIYDNYFNVNQDVPLSNQARSQWSITTQELKTRKEQKCASEINNRNDYSTGFDFEFSKPLYAATANYKMPGLFIDTTPWQRVNYEPLKLKLLFGFVAAVIKEKCSSILMANEYVENSNKEPVLFIHGFNKSGEMAGASYWGAFPKLISEANIDGREFQPYVFSWRTNARFNDVSRELSEAVKKINEDTGKQVHIVTHSFGGLLTRTMIQGLSLESNTTNSTLHPQFKNINEFETRVASVTTVGTPHSGLSRTEDDEHGLPAGMNGIHGIGSNIGCFALTCYQAGDKSFINDTTLSAYAGGYANIVKELRDSDYPNIATQALIGLGGYSNGLSGDFGEVQFSPYCQPIQIDYTPLGNTKICNPILYKKKDNSNLGDGLISLHGQRFYPNLKSQPLFKNNVIEERLLGFNKEGQVSLNAQNNIISSPKEEAISVSSKTSVPYSISTSTLYNVNTGSFNVYQTEYDLTSMFAVYHHESGQYVPRMRFSVLGTPNSLNTKGYFISQYTEVGLENCKAYTGYNQNCNHSTWRYVKDFLSKHVAQDVNQQMANITGEIKATENPAYMAANNNTTTLIDYAQAEIKVLSTILPGNLPLANGIANSDGTFSIPTEFIANNLDYAVQISMPGFRSKIVKGSDYQISVGDTPEESNLDFGEIVLQPNELVLGDLSFNIIDAFTGEQVSGFDITATNYVGNTFEGQNGLISQLSRGTYNVSFSKEGFADSSQLCVVNAYSSNVCRVAVMSLNQSSQDLVSVLRWGQDPRDLDTHMIKYKANGNEDYHIYFSNRRHGEPDNLDLDDTSSFGPETLSIDNLDPTATYVYAVHHYSGSGSITSTSEARVAVGQRGKQPRILYAPTSGEGEWWKVYEVRNNTVYPCQSDCMYDSVPTLNNANSSYSYQNSQPRWLLDMSMVINQPK